jgi:hypothetical protein
MLTVNDLQIVVLEDLKDFWSDHDIRQLYCDTINIKLNGYGNVYGSNIISADKIDYFGTHLIICQKGVRLKPLLAYKSVTLDKCEEFHAAFPCIPLVQTDGSEECLMELMNLINEAKNSNHQISFDYSWAQDPNIKSLRTPELKQLFQDLTMLLGVKHHEDHHIDEMIACGSVKVKTDLFFQKMGLKPISDDSIFKQSSLNGDLAQIFHTNEFSKYALEVSVKYKDLWDSRIVYSAEKRHKLKIAA